jgi:FlaA1/EpsC-like NDP-sugar epimerase
MNKNFSEFTKGILSIHRYSKRCLALLTDVCLCILCTWFAFLLRLEELILFKNLNYTPALISIVIAIPIFWIFGLYRTVFRYTGLSIIFTILTSTSIYGLLYFLAIGVYGIQGVPRSIGILQPILLFFLIICSRLFIKFILSQNYNVRGINDKKNVLVYGAGEAGRQLVISLENSPEFQVIGFLDDNEDLHRRVLLGQNVYSPSQLQKLIETKNINLVFLALPTIGTNDRNKIIEKLNQYKLSVKTLPSISEIVDGKITISDIKDLNIDDLLNRDPVKPDLSLLNKNINLKTVVVTGAGGSIGSELCRQIYKLKPNKLILIELNEFALYKIYEELLNINQNFKVIPLLINAKDQKKLEKVFELFQVDTVYHAAAYKHVPLVEENVCEGIENNVYSTLAIGRAAHNRGVKNVVLVSSDKAVKPTNIMGASKRLSELCIQGIYNENKNSNTQFSIVRFGNVLESSGSVIPKFKRQIKEGGPVTLTHEDVTRYFMTVTEAAELVIQAGAMGKGSEVFVLDMGESIKIKNLIQKMIKLSGFSIKDHKNPDGDIEIKIVGLRPGEKLYEELLIGDNPLKTNHPKIRKIHEAYIPFDKLKNDLDYLKGLLINNKVDQVKFFLQKILSFYQPEIVIVDHIYNQQILTNKKKENPILLHKKNEKVIKIK